ncbi:serine hydrolase domain-containing protein [Nguyenibacter vanlangensis]|uniref:Serine hydrolase n=1 Tax=Nguyenibacter vanlangensis TaxID=1216886 RepID=A0A7Y7IVN6_9PROT|nr:serine hydrolase [Nguyenibacter vanlangensis]NVN10933.1 serine hydrolase [Nguyenibacter vanlangensis]
MKKKNLAAVSIVLCGTALASAALWTRPDRALRILTGGMAHDICSETFVSLVDPRETIAERRTPGGLMGRIDKAMRYDVDHAHQTVRASILGAFSSRAIYRPGIGCTLVYPGESLAPVRLPGVLTDHPEESAPVETAIPALHAALDASFAASAQPARHPVKAVVIMHDGRIIAERYAPGYGVDTPVFSFSVAKSVMNALVGILVRDGAISVADTAPIPAWHGPDDPRHAITIENLMRMDSGLNLDEAAGWTDLLRPRIQNMFAIPDPFPGDIQAGLVSAPGTRWAYSSATTHILARIVRDAAGGSGASVQDFAFRELFLPVGMRHATLEMDATGTPIGASGVLASARDWARFGTLYLNDGIVDGKRILPAGWARFSATPTLNANYGAGWWTNRHAPAAAPPVGMPIMAGVPDDTYYAMGKMGQFIAIVPSRRLVVVWLSRSDAPFFGIRNFGRLVASAVATVRGDGHDVADDHG